MYIFQAETDSVGNLLDDDGTPLVGKNPTEQYMSDPEVSQAINGRQNLTRNARKAELEKEKAAKIHELLKMNLPNLADKLQKQKNCTLKKGYPPLIELGKQNRIMQQEFGANSVKNKATGSNSSELYIYHFFKR